MVMAAQNLISDALGRLEAHFGPSLLKYPPMNFEIRRQLEEIVGALPLELAEFLTRCNGLRVHTTGSEDVHLWGASEMLASVVDPNSSIVPRCFLPFRGDPTGERNWIITEFRPALGAIVTWDPWTPRIRLLASSFGYFLSAWVDYLEQCYRKVGGGCDAGPQCAFGEQWVKNDLRLQELQKDPIILDWMHKIAEAATCDSASCRAANKRTLNMFCGPISGRGFVRSNPAPSS